tara:strand:+ start:6509 stop:6841 length:333 start_codon:yes stop_codon:yes gene_type:complete
MIKEKAKVKKVPTNRLTFYKVDRFVEYTFTNSEGFQIIKTNYICIDKTKKGLKIYPARTDGNWYERIFCDFAINNLNKNYKNLNSAYKAIEKMEKVEDIFEVFNFIETHD